MKLVNAKLQKSLQAAPKIKSKSALTLGILVIGIGAVATNTNLIPARALPMNSPSAIAAVRLKYHPPNNWLKHYLGDDRYKIAGGVWKVVSTQMDTYYHRANCPNMMRQQAGITIGFANWNEAEESGYVADPYCAPSAPIVSYNVVTTTVRGAKGRGISGANAGAIRGVRIRLSDGKSTVILPRGWTHRALGNQQASAAGRTANYVGDVLTGPSNSGAVTFVFANAPNNINMESVLTPQTVSKLREQLQSRAASDPGFASALEGAQVGSTTLGGLKGISVVPGKGAKLPAGMGGRVTIVARGSKMYIMAAQMGSRDTNYGVITKSFQPN